MSEMDTKLKEPRTQILITDIPKKQLESKWPVELERQLFEQKFPELKRKLQYYTPLAFLNRIVLIFEDEVAAVKVYDYLKESLLGNGHSFRIYLTESLLARPRAKSVDQVRESSEQIGGKDKPVLSIDTDTSKTGVNSSSLSLGSPSLSPDRNNLDSPTLLKFDNESKLHYYQEPLPGMHKTRSPPRFSPTLKINTTASGSSGDLNRPPPSPSITINGFPH